MQIITHTDDCKEEGTTVAGMREDVDPTLRSQRQCVDDLRLRKGELKFREERVR